jgi:hypothetical protein
MRSIKCPYCDGEVLSQQNGQTTSAPNLYPRLGPIVGVFSAVVNALGDTLNAILGGVKTVPRAEAIGGAKNCVCGGTKVLKDYSDTAVPDQKTADYYRAETEKILELEGKKGNSPGGSRITRIAGADVLLVGHGFNDAKTYTIIKDGKAVPGNTVSTKAASIPSGAKTDAIVHHNVPANSAGGRYYIQCSNKFQVVAGAQGIVMSTKGPIMLDGSAITFTGAEVGFASQTDVTVAGKNVMMTGDLVTLRANPGEKRDGKVTIDGGCAVTGNFSSPGAMVDSLYFKKGVCPKRQTTSKISAPTNITGGPAAWGGFNTNATRLALKDIKKYVTETTGDPKKLGETSPLTLGSDLSEKIFNMGYSMLPFELKQTGWCIITSGSSAGLWPIINFPHVHPVPNDTHYHIHDEPALTYCTTSDEVGEQWHACGGDGPLPVQPPAGESIFQRIARTVYTGYASIQAALGIEETKKPPYTDAVT